MKSQLTETINIAQENQKPFTSTLGRVQIPRKVSDMFFVWKSGKLSIKTLPVGEAVLLLSNCIGTRQLVA